MLIRCPQCQLERKIDATVIPPSAVMATCPSCKAKFRFRDPETPGAPVSMSAPSSGNVPDSVPPPTADAPQVKKDIEGGKPFAVPVRLSEPAARRLDKTADQVPSTNPTSQTHLTGPKAPAEREESAESPLRAAPQKGEQAENGDDSWMDVPFERPDRYGNLLGLYQTIVRVMFNAPKFFASIPRCRGSIMRPLLFYVLLGLFQVLIKLLWFSSIDPSMTDPQVQELISSADMSLAMTFIVSPVILAMQAFFYSSLFFLMFRLVQPEVSNFPVIFRVVAYSSAPMIVCAVPVIGPLVAMLWFALSCFVGCRFALNLPWHKVALALVPLYLIGFAITMQFVQHLLSQG